MLVLSRKERQSIIISTPQGDVTVTVVRMAGGTVRIGIDAPREFPVWRQEIHRKLTSRVTAEAENE